MDLLVDKTQKSRLRKNEVLAQRGRPPWFGTDGKPTPAYVIGVTGGSASGKSSVAQRIISALKVPWVLVIGQDSFYKTLSPDQSERAFRNEYDFDNPDAFDYELLRQCIADLRQSRSVQIPCYSFKEHQRTSETQYLYGASVIIVEGILVLHDSALRDLLDLKIFVQCDSDLMLARRIRRDIIERGREIDGILQQYLKYVKPSYDNHILPTSRHADIIVPGYANDVAIDIIQTHIRKELDERNLALRDTLSKAPAPQQPATPRPGAKMLSYSETHAEMETHNLIVLKQTQELESLHTALRSPKTPKASFAKQSGQVADMLIERALELITPPEQEGDDGSLFAVTIAGVGSGLQDALHRAREDVKVGSLTIESHQDTSEPVLCETSLPEQLRQSHEAAGNSRVLLLDSQIGTGAAAIMALRVLLDHGVKQESIVLVCFVCSRRGGCTALAQAYPDVRILTSCVDEGMEHLQTEGHTAKVTDKDKDKGSDADRHPWTTFFLDADQSQG